mmetsp:Transcript_2273/g.3439  ORF Transcript_2273/g.3439 Transcript_2273/m.3439 type:complete len:148 (-) Transcript_2273:25-468(-)|eukprot:CAMPEP_0197240532 /NCGR_PEP_ID=MMETSP1429-20130617/6803_1 /TAXON_ID=49237 /ORGANISM="Chaetoceros  sp., Strain UNC1202" /LENGTH=147 /DNA_ID=CAMNT_0042700193 /DNA_START=51 /DNA_END=494 /DNA_ORIENTATION=-
MYSLFQIIENDSNCSMDSTSSDSSTLQKRQQGIPIARSALRRRKTSMPLPIPMSSRTTANTAIHEEIDLLEETIKYNQSTLRMYNRIVNARTERLQRTGHTYSGHERDRRRESIDDTEEPSMDVKRFNNQIDSDFDSSLSHIFDIEV